MSRTKLLTGECQHCGGHMEFPADTIGLVAPCPHCQHDTELLLTIPPLESTVPRKVIVWTVIAVVILGGGLLASVIALKRAEHWAARQKQAALASLPTVTRPENSAVEPPADGSAQNSFSSSSMTLEKAGGTSLVYAVGTIRNTSTRQRFGVKVELDLLDGSGQKIGTATDYQQVVEPGAKWAFKALVVPSGTVSARIASIKEDQ